MTRCLRFVLLFLGFGLVNTSTCADRAFAQTPATAPAHHWSYSGPGSPAHWGDLDPDFALCKDGKRQSPINIKKARKADLPPIQFDYKPTPLRIVNNGHSIQINYGPGSTIMIGGKQYMLVQFHFHRPSEEEIGGKHFEMVVHMVHKDDAGNAAVVAVLLKSGNESPFIQKLWDNLPKEADKEMVVTNVTVNIAELLPANQNYYSFAGSLTTPPCSEGVSWYVLKTPVEVSARQVAAFAKFYPDNARPIQPTNGREIWESNSRP
ncbi:MAG: carbonic anhydrase family protein [Terriglobia bacterium]|jgi:carbonic anhydrase